MKTPAERVLSALMVGKEVTINDFTYRFFKKGDEVPWGKDMVATATASHLRTKAHGADGGEVWLPIDFDLGAFVDMCDMLSFDELFLMGAEAALIKMAQEDNAHKKRHQGEPNVAR